MTLATLTAGRAPRSPLHQRLKRLHSAGLAMRDSAGVVVVALSRVVAADQPSLQVRHTAEPLSLGQLCLPLQCCHLKLCACHVDASRLQPLHAVGAVALGPRGVGASSG